MTTKIKNTELRHLNSRDLTYKVLTWFCTSVTTKLSSPDNNDLVLLMTAGVVELFLVGLVVGRPLISERSAIMVRKAKQGADMLREG